MRPEDAALVQVIITFALAIATIIYVILTSRYVRLTNKILQTNQMANIDELRPFVVVSLPSKDDAVYLVIQNIGLRPAYNIQIDFDPPISTLYESDKANYPNSDNLLKLGFIPPNIEIHNMICSPEKIAKAQEPYPVFNVSISYNEYRGKLSYKENYKIDLNSYIYGGKIRQYSDQHFYNKISKKLELLSELKTINRYLSTISDNLSEGKQKYYEDGTPIE